MIITISGLPGSGKSVLTKGLAEKLAWTSFSMGNLRRRKAQELGMTLAEYNKLGETDPETDLAVDRYQEELGKKEDKFIIEGRTSWHFIPQALKIFLKVSPAIGAERIWYHLEQHDNERNEDHHLDSIEAVALSNEARLASDRLRYQKYFNIDVYDESHYDLVVDTTKLTPDAVLAKVYEFVINRI